MTSADGHWMPVARVAVRVSYGPLGDGFLGGPLSFHSVDPGAEPLLTHRRVAQRARLAGRSAAQALPSSADQGGGPGA